MVVVVLNFNYFLLLVGHVKLNYFLVTVFSSLESIVQSSHMQQTLVAFPCRQLIAFAIMGSCLAGGELDCEHNEGMNGS